MILGFYDPYDLTLRARRVVFVPCTSRAIAVFSHCYLTVRSLDSRLSALVAVYQRRFVSTSSPGHPGRGVAWRGVAVQPEFARALGS